jgi:hypothetical protein
VVVERSKTVEQVIDQQFDSSVKVISEIVIDQLESILGGWDIFGESRRSCLTGAKYI